MKNLLFAISAACCVCVAGARIVDGNLALNVQDGDVQTFDEDLLFQGWSRVFTIPAGVTAVFNGNLAMATPEGNSVFVGGSESTLGRPGVRGRVREGPRTNGKSKCRETRPMGAGRKCAESNRSRSACGNATCGTFQHFQIAPNSNLQALSKSRAARAQMQNPEKTLRAPRRNVLIYLPIYSAPAEE